MSKTNFVNWSKGSFYRKEFALIGKDLYPGQELSDKIPKGLRMLRAVMLASRGELYKVDTGELPIIDDLIGFGSYGTVYGTHRKGSFIKLSRFGARHHRERELKALLELSKDAPKHLGVSTLVNNQNKALQLLEFSIRGCPASLPYLELEPRGISCPAAMGRGLTVCDAANQLHKTITYIHQKMVYHNDICPKNIVAVECPHQWTQWQVILIDFGASLIKDGAIEGFTPAFAHDQVLINYISRSKLTSRPQFDLASLTFTVAALVQKCSRAPWKSCQLSKDGPGDVWYRDRQKHASEILTRVEGATGDFWDKWREYLG